MSHRRTARVVVAAMLFVLFTIAAFGAEVPALQIASGDGTFTITNATPGGSVVLFASGIDGSRGVLRQRKLATSVAASAAGTLEYKPERPLPYRTILVAVDVESGRIAIGGPPDYEVQVRPFPTETLRRDSDGVSGVADAEIPRAEVLVVRPKTGAWQLTAAEGASGDKDQRHDGRLALDFESAKAITGNTAAPKRLKQKDVVVVIDSARLEVFTTEIDQ
jgi:hypothetical protein